MSLLSKFSHFINYGSKRTITVKKNILGSFGIKGFSLLITLFLVPLTIDLLDKEKYGIWITIFSIVSWFNLLDMGIGNGFRNKFAEAIALGNDNLGKQYVQTFYSSMGIIAFVFLLLFTLVNQSVNWHKILNLNSTFDENISQIIWFVFALFCVQLYIKNISTILMALQKTVESNAIILFTNVASFVLIYILKLSGWASLFSIALSFMIGPILVYLIASIYYFNTKLFVFKPVLFTFPKKKFVNNLIGLGLKFFFIQITSIVMYLSSNIIITQLYGPAEVTPYNVAFRLYSSIQVVFSIIVTPFWSAFTEAYTKNDYVWMKNSIRKLIVIWFVFSIGVSVVWLLSPYIFKIWVGEKVGISNSLSLQFAFFVIINSLSSIFMFFVNGIGKISIASIGATFQLITYIPLAIFLSKYNNLHLVGIVLATNICLIIPLIFVLFQTKKILNETASGIWNK